MTITITIGKAASLLWEPGIIGSVLGAAIGAGATVFGFFIAGREVREAARRYNEESD